MNNFLIRQIKPEDNPEIERIIKAIFPEFNMPMVGTAFEDKETPRMFESYQDDKEFYLVIEEAGKVVGGGGIKPLKDFQAEVCELQKMYLDPNARGKGYGKLLFDACLMKARNLGYTKCYLESASQLKTAIRMYEKNGFQHLEESLGNTGHYSCGVWMIRDL